MAADISYYKGREDLLVVDFFKVSCLTSKNSKAVILAMKDRFAHHDIPERLIADMPFNSLKFKNFASNWEIEVVILSPHYLKSNAFVKENNI